MKLLREVCVVGLILTSLAGAQDSPAPALRKGVSVQMAAANHSVEMREADEPNAEVVAITANGEVYEGIQRTEPTALSRLSAKTIYVKADGRVPYQTLLTVLDALHGKSVVLLTAPPANAQKAKYVSPYGIEMIVPR